MELFADILRDWRIGIAGDVKALVLRDVREVPDIYIYMSSIILCICQEETGDE